MDCQTLIRRRAQVQLALDCRLSGADCLAHADAPPFLRDTGRARAAILQFGKKTSAAINPMAESD
jgi:hypothetical protein